MLMNEAAEVPSRLPLAWVIVLLRRWGVLPAPEW